jgi:lipopolysaccharide/colanic/teichoic acid biosynthesis glycosyltransferase
MIHLAQGTVSPAKRPRVLRSGTFGRDRPIGWHHLISQELFRDALARERKRADRFEEAFVLVLVSLDSQASRQSRWGRLFEALSKTKLDTDVIGWFEQGSVLGLIRSLADRDPKEMAATLASAIRAELVRCLTPDNADCCSIRFEVYSPHSDWIPPVLLNAENRRRTPQEVVRDAAKRALDIAGSAVFLIAFSPVFLIVSALVKLTSKGPVFFRQQRVGEAARPFMMLKFRTMHVNADERIHQQYVETFIQSSKTSESAKDSAKNVVFKIVDDPRVTPIGHFLRRSSLDEFPQFWNVLCGDMSLVGPRPPLSYEVARYKRWHRRRVLEAKPGITGLWQVTGRSRTTFDEMVRLDLRYARNCSVWTDLKILLATPRAVLSGRGAH